MKRITITGDRGLEWELAVGTATFPVWNTQPIRASLPGRPDAKVWMLAVTEVDSDLLERIFTHLAKKFGMSYGDVRADALSKGIPILTDDTVVFHDTGRLDRRFVL